ncbi:hypothetical protein Tsubulata_046490 [Turnera subulata]|uniref:Uncharacterized protein n=1 Tax=Turnera subulata TaxID=218843 RepID=A0A9Q0JM10_9ROSI|nr:hypothetical protein Tsubulata_046490 [Turnera subulata]
MSSSRIEDRTEDFKDALESIGELEQFMMKHRKVYEDQPVSEVKNHLCKIEEFQFKVNPFISDKLLCIAYFVSLQMRLRIRPRFKGCRRDLEGWE